MTVLVTGFDAFGEETDNPSGAIAGDLDGAQLAGESIHGIVLPVATERVSDLLHEALQRVEPDLLIVLGVATGRSAPSVERLAANVLDFPIPDVDGRRIVDRPVVEDGPTAYLSELPIKAIVADWQAAGIPGSVSNTAGTYLCNQVFYLARHLTAATGCRAGLIHLPCTPEAVAGRQRADAPVSTMELDTMTRAVRGAVQTSVRHRGADIELGWGALH